MAISLSNLNGLNKLKGLNANENSSQSTTSTVPAPAQNLSLNLPSNNTADAEIFSQLQNIPTVSTGSPNPEPQPTANNSTANTTTSVANDTSLDPEIASRLEELAYQLNQSLPDIRTHLLFIHKAMLKDPAQVTLLTIQQRATYFQSLSKQTRVELTAKAASTSKASKKTANLDLDGFM
jgi:hypothetical protein